MSKSIDSQVEELRAMSSHLLKIADELEGDLKTPSYKTDRQKIAYKSRDGIDSDNFLLSAAEIYRSRRRRELWFSADLFGEPAWDLLLDLYVARLKKKNVSVTSACLASNVPATTALRWLSLLTDSKLIERLESKADQRVTWVRLTDLAFEKMTDCISDTPGNFFKSKKVGDEYLFQSVAKDRNK